MFYRENGLIDLNKCKEILIKEHMLYTSSKGKEGNKLVFEGEDLTGVHFFNCDFCGNNFSGSSFTKCCFDETTSKECYKETEVKLG